MDFFEHYYASATEHDGTPFQAIWVHNDGRCLGMTGQGQHRLSSIPFGFVKGSTGLTDNVSIYSPLSR